MISIIKIKFLLKPMVLLLTSVVFTTACSYSFTGASVPPHIKSIAIPYFRDRSNSGEPDLAEKFTTELTNRFLDDNTLIIAEKVNSDAVVECTILPFKDNPVVISGGEQVASRRITLTVKVIYRDLVKKKIVFDKNFSNYGDYRTDGDPVSQRNDAIELAIERITEDVLLGVVANW